jgi:anti-anti-sigma factor
VEISLKKNGTAGVLTLGGLVGREHVPRLKDYVELLLGNGASRIYFDLSGARSITISAIGALCRLREEVSSRGGTIYLMGLQREVNDLVSLQHLRRFFPTHEGPVPWEQPASPAELPAVELLLLSEDEPSRPATEETEGEAPASGQEAEVGSAPAEPGVPGAASQET